MDAKSLYAALDRDFILPECSDNWSEIGFNEYYTENYSRTYMGIVLDNSAEIGSVYTAVFPSDSVLTRLFNADVSDTLLFVHHPMDWDIAKIPVFTAISMEDLAEMKRRRVSMYNLHVPLDRNGYYSTSVNLARAVGAEETGEFGEYYGCLMGVYAKTGAEDVYDLKERFELSIGHKARLYQYGGKSINLNTVAFGAGGGNMPEFYEIFAEKGVNTYVTGIATMETGHSGAVKAHENAKKYGVNILAGTHYSTEKFACMRMKEYFAKLGLPCEFLADVPNMKDM